MNAGTFAGFGTATTSDNNPHAIGTVALYPTWLGSLYTTDSATYLQTGSWVKASDTLLPSDSPWITRDGDLLNSPFSGFSGNAMRQDYSGNGLIGSGSGSSLTFVEVREGITLPQVVIPSIPSYTNISDGAGSGFRFNDRLFVALYDNDSALNTIEEVTNGVAVRRFTPTNGTYSSAPRGFANIGDTGILVRADGNSLLGIHRSTDGGTTWTQIAGPSGGTIGRVHASETLFVAARVDAASISTSPTGAAGSWTTRTVPTGTGVSDCYYTPSGALLVLTNLGQVYRSANDGVSWTLIFTDILARAFSYDFVNQRVILTAAQSVTNNGLLYTSTDDGITWQSHNAGLGTITALQYPLVQIQAVRGWAGQQLFRLTKGAVGSGSTPTTAGTSSSLVTYYLRIR